MRLSDFKVLSFDCYGTLIDWETGLWRALQPLVTRSRKPVEREAALALFAELESEAERETAAALYSDILARTFAARCKAGGYDERRSRSRFRRLGW